MHVTPHVGSHVGSHMHITWSPHHRQLLCAPKVKIQFMFALTRISDLLRITPDAFDLPTEQSLRNAVHHKYANHVIPGVGLCVCLYDILEADDGLIKPGDGSVFVKTQFRMVVFKPFVGEVLIGWISQNLSEGIKVKLGFFDDIFIPKHLLFEGSEFDEKEKTWIWKTEGQTYFLDVDEKIRFRVEDELFNDTKPHGPIDTFKDPQLEDDQKDKVPPYALVASCCAEGMGPTTWWD